MSSFTINDLDKRLRSFSDEELKFLKSVVTCIKNEANGKVCGTCIYKQQTFCTYFMNINIDSSSFIKIFRDNAVACSHYKEA
jgi:hypothetical protein